MKFLIIVVFVFSIFTPIGVFAHGNGFFEFAPDSSSGLLLSSANSPEEIFLPQNEFLGGIDIWLDNPGSAGILTLELRRHSNNQLVTSKTINVGQINPVAGGKRTHVDFGGAVSVSGNQKYKIMFVTAMPDLKLYYSNRIGIVGHNEPQISQYINGVAGIGGQEQDFSFKFALYEATESSSPVISNVSVMALSPYQARLNFNANEPVDIKVEYGISGQGLTSLINFDGSFEYCGSGIALCSILLDTEPNNNYQYTLTVKDSWGNLAMHNGNFEAGVSVTATPEPTLSQDPEPTPEEPIDNEAPVISNARALNFTTDSADFAWHTDEAANSWVIVRLLPELITINSNNDPTFEMEHLVTVNGIGAGSLYRAYIRSGDNFGNESSLSFDFSIPQATPTLSVSPEPQQSTPAPTIQVDPGEKETEVSWINENPSADGYRINVFDSENNLVYSADLSSVDKATILKNLPKGEYTVIVYENNDGAYKKISEPKKVRIGSSFWLGPLPYLLAGLAVLAGLAFRLFLKKKAPSPVPKNSM